MRTHVAGNRFLTRLILVLPVLATAGCALDLPTFPADFVHPNHIAGGPSWTTGAASIEESEPDVVGRATGAYLQYERRLTKYLYVQVPFEFVSAAKVQRGRSDAPTEYSSLYLTPAVEVRGPSDWWIQGFASGGAGLARFETSEHLLTDGTSLAARSTNRLAPFLNLGADVQFSAHWSIRTDLRGRYVEPDFVEHSRSRLSFSVLPVFRF
jgi:hypothetical protein